MHCALWACDNVQYVHLLAMDVSSSLTFSVAQLRLQFILNFNCWAIFHNEKRWFASPICSGGQTSKQISGTVLAIGHLQPARNLNDSRRATTIEIDASCQSQYRENFHLTCEFLAICATVRSQLHQATLELRHTCICSYVCIHNHIQCIALCVCLCIREKSTSILISFELLICCDF